MSTITTDEINNTWNSKSGSFVKRPGKGWLHSDEKMQQEGVIYNVKYVGLIPVNESMKSLSFEVRTLVARESIRRVAEYAYGTNFRRVKKPDENINRILNSRPELHDNGLDIALHINIQYLKASLLDADQALFQHMMQNISFACGGDTDIQNYVAYVAKDEYKGRACYVFECDNGLANNVITTIGQAFELRFKKFLNSIPSNNTTNTKTMPHNLHSSVPQNLNTKENFLANSVSPTNTHGVEIPIKKLSLVEQTQNTNHGNGHHSNEPLSPNLDENLHRQLWFHGMLTRENAELLLKNDGDYLVRTSNKTADKQYVLSGRYKGEYRHIFLVDPTGIVRTKDRVFDNVCHLIKYHQDHNIPIVSKDNELLLVNPISKYSLN